MSKHLVVTSPDKVIENSVLVRSSDDIDESTYYHTSLGDITAKDFLKLSKLFSSVSFNVDHFSQETDIFHHTKNTLTYLSHFRPISGINSYGSENNRKGVSFEKIKGYGCSFLHGTGIHQNQRFLQLLCDHYHLKEHSKSLPGSSVYWSLREIVNGDIAHNDLVIWQLTTVDRFTLCTKFPNTTNEIMLARADKNLIKTSLTSDSNLWFNYLEAVKIGIALLRSKNCRFVLVSLSLPFPVLSELVKNPEFVYNPDYIVDKGFDNLHPGEESNKNMANDITKHISNYYSHYDN